MFSTYSSSSSSDGKRAHPAFHVQHPRYQPRRYHASNPPQSNGETMPFEGCSRMHRTTATYAVAWSPSGRTPDGGDWGGRSARGNHRGLPTRDCISIAIIANTIHATIALWPSSTADHLLLDWYAVPDIAPLRPARASAAQRYAHALCRPPWRSANLPDYFALIYPHSGPLSHS